MLIPSESAFSLTKVKLCKDGGLESHYEVKEIIGNESYTNKYHVVNTKDIHPDLYNLFKAMRPIVARIFNMKGYQSIMEDESFERDGEQKEHEQNKYDDLFSHIYVRGLSISGVGDNVGVVITSIYYADNDLETTIKTPRVKLSSDAFGFKLKINEIVEGIEKEVYAYLFKDKKAQLELFGASNE